MDTIMIVLRLIHIGAGVFWGGAIFFTAYLLGPAVQGAGPAGGKVVRQLATAQRFPVVIGMAALLTILSGVGMYWRNNFLSGGTWSSSRPAMAYGVGAVFALIAFITALARIAPTVKALVALGSSVEASGAPATPEQASTLATLQARMASASRMVAANVAIATLVMAIARYL